MQVRSTISVYFLIALASFLFLTRLHERHLLQALPCFIVLFHNHKHYYIQLAYLSLFVVMNLFFVWHPISLIIRVGFIQLALIKVSIIGVLMIFYYRLFIFMKKAEV